MCENIAACRSISAHAPAFSRHAMLAGMMVLTRSPGNSEMEISVFNGWGGEGREEESDGMRVGRTMEKRVTG